MASSKLTIGDLLYKLGFENEDQFVASLDQVLNEADKKISKEGKAAGEKGGKATGKGFSDQFKATFSGAAIGSFIGTALSQAFSSAVAATTKFVGDSIREYAVYEQGLIQLKLAGETNLTALSKRIQDTARATKVFSATDVSLAVGELVKAGYDAETAFALVETGALGAASEVDAVTGRFGDLGGVAGQLGNILRALNLDTSQTGRVMDVLARAAQDSNLNVSDLVDIVSRVGPTAKLAGLEIEDLAAMAGVLANNGMEASLIGTGLRSVLQSLINPSGNVKAELDKLGISLVDSEGNLRDFSQVLDGLHELTERGGEGLQLLTAATGSFGSAAAANLGSASEEVKAFRQSLEDAEGTAQTLADTMRNSAAGSLAETEARIKDAKAALGDQLMPVMLALHEDVLPPLINLLGELIQKWTDWEFIITGTTRALEKQQEALRGQVIEGLGEELGQALLDLQDARQATADAQARVNNLSVLEFGARAKFQHLLDDAITAEEAAQARYDRLLQQRRDLASWTVPDQFGPQGMPEGWTPQQTAAAVDTLVESYRNLAAVEAELAAERERFAAATTAEEERQSAARIKALEAEVAAKKGLYAQQQAAAKAAGITKDPLVEEATRVQNDLQRLKLGYEQGTLSREAYVQAQEAHMRRLDGLYDRSTTTEQSLAVLRARKGVLDELARLEEQSGKQLDRIRAVNKDREDEQRYPRTLAGSNLRARIQANERALAEAEVKARREAYERTGRPALERLQAERAALEAGERPGAIDSAAVAQNIRARQLARQREADAEEQKKRQAAIDEARKRNNQRVLNELLAQEAAYNAELEAQAQARADREAEIAAGRAFRATQEGIRHSLSNLYAGYATEATQYVTLTERAEGVTVRLAQAQRTLGLATRDDVIGAVDTQIAAIERLLPIVDEGSERYYELVAALEAARATLKALNDEVPEFRIPTMGTPEQMKKALAEVERTVTALQDRLATETDQSVIALLEVRIQQYTALLRELGIAVADLDAAAAAGKDKEELDKEAARLASEVVNIAKSFPVAIVEGIRSGDIGGALEQALGGAADYFLDMMLKSILGPITEELTAAIAKSLAAKSAGDAASGVAGAAGGLGALGPTGLIIGGVAVLASMLIGASKQRKAATERNQQTVRAAVSGAPSVTYNLSATVQVQPGANFGDPRWEAELRSFVQRVAEDLYRRVPRGGS